jgi:hypothetical protein
MNANVGLRKILLAAMVLLAIAASPWSAGYEAPVQTQITFDPRCTTATCEAIIDYGAKAKAKDGQPSLWSERVRVKVDMAAILASACVVDDGPRPHGFAQSLKPCQQ